MVTRSEKVEEIRKTAASADPAERDSVIDALCGDDAELRRDVLAATAASRETNVVKSIGKYRIESVLGEGGMGVVYLASDPQLERRVALKVLPSKIVGDRDRLARFEREARAASGLNHPNIMTVHEFGETDGVHYLVSEYIEGRTLREFLDLERLTVSSALDIAIQVASALDIAHRSGIVHRDIKPENVMIREDGLVKVLDFGIAKVERQPKSPTVSSSEDETRDLVKTAPGAVLGTTSYMSPEQARGLETDARTDVWSLGVVIYEILTGRRPFDGPTTADTIVAILSGKLTPPSELVDGLPAGIDAVVAKMLARDADERYASAADVRARLEEMRTSITSDRPAAEIVEKQSVATDTGVHTTAGVVDAKTAADADRKSVQRTFSSIFANAPGRAVAVPLAALILAGLAIAVYIFWPTTRKPIDSIAVLPLENISGDPNLTAIGDGLSETLLDRLSELPQLRVISRASSFQFRGPGVDVRDVATKLGVRAVMVGTVMRDGDEVLVRIETIDADDNTHVTGFNVRRRSSEISGLQSDIARNAAAQLELRLSDAQARRVSSGMSEDSEALGYYLAGLVELNGPKDARSSARDYFRRAVTIDPNFAVAFAELAWLQYAVAMTSSDPERQLPEARAAVDRALTSDPSNAKAHVVRALLKEAEYDWKSAERDYLRAIELSPNLVFARSFYSNFLSTSGRFDEAMIQFEELRARDPINRREMLLSKAIVESQSRKFDESLQTLQLAQAVEPTRPVQEFPLGYAYGGKGDLVEAANHYRKSIELLGGDSKFSQPLVYLAATLAKMPGKQAEARQIVAKIESMSSYKSPAIMAIPYAALGDRDRDRAMQYLEVAFQKKDPLLRYIAGGYEYDDLRDDPRFKDLLRRIGMGK